MRIKRILVPVDFSPASLEALRFAADFAKPAAAELMVLTVVEPMRYVVPDYGGAQTAALADVLEEQRRIARIQLGKLARRYAKRKIPLRAALDVGPADVAIISAAERSKADLIIMSTHGRTGLSRLLIGSVAERVVRTASCPVLTLRAKARGARRKSAASTRRRRSGARIAHRPAAVA